MTNDPVKELCELLKGCNVTFSQYCRSGLLERCECWRCRESRGEPVTSESNTLAERQSREADTKQRLAVRAALAELEAPDA